ncbi:MAG: DinB family protein [bacterium]|nr:DinB family protein [bacterium]
MNLSQRPGDHECFDYHCDYVAKVPDGDIIDTLEKLGGSAVEFIHSIPDDQFEVIHPPYGWRIRTVLEHCCDAERVFGYRALRFAAGDKTDLPGWDENHYATCGYGDAPSKEFLAAEFGGLRAANLALFGRLRPEAFDEIGTADGRKVSVRTLAWLMAGHWLHHEAILRKRLNS